MAWKFFNWLARLTHSDVELKTYYGKKPIMKETLGYLAACSIIVIVATVVGATMLLLWPIRALLEWDAKTERV